jgi:hypothetical protein
MVVTVSWVFSLIALLSIILAVRAPQHAFAVMPPGQLRPCP